MDKNKRDRLWAEAKRRGRLSSEAVIMAKEMGLNPANLIKNIPSPAEPWKAPLEDWVRQIHAKRERHRER